MAGDIFDLLDMETKWLGNSSGNVIKTSHALGFFETDILDVCALFPHPLRCLGTQEYSSFALTGTEGQRGKKRVRASPDEHHED